MYFHRWGAAQWQEVFSLQKREKYNWYKPIWKLAYPANYPKIPRLQELSEVGLRPQMLACGWTEVSCHPQTLEIPWKKTHRRRAIATVQLGAEGDIATCCEQGIPDLLQDNAYLFLSISEILEVCKIFYGLTSISTYKYGQKTLYAWPRNIQKKGGTNKKNLLGKS